MTRAAKPKARERRPSERNRSGPRRRRTTRLPPDVRPSTIELHFELDPGSRRFRGEACYSLQLDRRRRQIELHAADLKISRVRVWVRGEAWRGRVSEHPECETVVLHFDRLLPAEAVRLELGFRGRVRSDLRGLYRSAAGGRRAAQAEGPDEAGDEGDPWIATQLCPTDARRFFPAFDEPGIKARYRIAVTAPADQTVLSNSPIESQERTEDGRRRVQFELTPPLSSYLLAVAVGPFEASPKRMSGDTEIRVHTLPGRQRLAAFACEAAAESLSRLEQWFDMPHPYPKLDLIALPDFAFGAMENAGAVFFRDSVLLLDSADTSADDRQRTAETIAHELAHMWFGNLVTMAWWNDLWLNESFATWMAYEIVDDWQPDWRIWLEFAHRRESALEVDALANSHPIAPPIRTADEAHENFDAITYTKGASVLRMLERYLGREVFREGVRLYIRRHRERCATAEDLWSALSEVSGESIAEIVAPWTLQTGYPLVSLRRRQRQGSGTLELRQERFLSLPPRGGRSAEGSQRSTGTRWTIPWIGRVGPGPKGDAGTLRHLLSKRRDQIPGQAPESSWIYGNADEAGFFRVEHDEGLRIDLLAGITSLSPIERIGLVGHQWALARARRSELASLLDLLAVLGPDRDPNVLAAVQAVLARLLGRLAWARGEATLARLREWVAVHYGGQIDALGLDAPDDDDPREGTRRARAIEIVGGLAQAEPLLTACRHRLARHLEAGDPLPAELADEIVRLGALGGDAELHAALRLATREASTPQARRRYLLGLAAFDEPRTLRATHRASLDAALAPMPDRALLLMTLLGRPATAVATWEHLMRSWRRLERHMPPILLARLAGATSVALPPKRAREIQRFFQQNPLAAGSRVLRQVAEELAIARRFEAEAGPELERYLSR